MAGDKHILIETILQAVSSDEPEQHADRVRAALLLNSSHSPSSCALVDGITVAHDTGWRGLAVDGLRVPLSTVMADLAEADLPEGLREREPDLELEDYRAALRVIATLLFALERRYDGESLLLRSREGAPLAWLKLRWRETRAQRHDGRRLTVDVYDVDYTVHETDWRASEVLRLLDEASAAANQGAFAVHDAIQTQLQRAAVLTDENERQPQLFTLDRGDDGSLQLVLVRGTASEPV